MIMTGGLNVYPRELEIVLEQHPSVAEAAVAGVPHERWGEQVTAWVVLRDGYGFDEAALIAHARAGLAGYKCPKQVFQRASLPRNHVGKIVRRALCHVNPALARLIAQVTGVPVSVSDAAGDGGGQVMMTPGQVTGAASPLAAHGKPEVMFVGTEFCPYCATQSWSMIVALSRFGTFTGLATIRSARYELFPSLATWTFYGSAYTSSYLAFVPVETRSNVLIGPKDNPQSTSSYTRLQKLTPAQQAIYGRFDKLGGVPFLDFGNRYVLTGSSFPPAVLEHQTWSQIAAALRNPRSAIGRAILGAANYITAAICALTGDQPASACTAVVRSLLGHRPASSPGAAPIIVWSPPPSTGG
jgi:Domain of unknown function (DUF929)/AMP-binding enzyme C-terminal domain